MFNGLNKYFEHLLSLHKNGMAKFDEKKVEEIQSSIGLINSNLDKREHELMRIFDCDPRWPMCLYDFTFKNKQIQFLTMKTRRSLKEYIVEGDYFTSKGVTKKPKRKLVEDPNEVLKAHMNHLCTCPKHASTQ